MARFCGGVAGVGFTLTLRGAVQLVKKVGLPDRFDQLTFVRGLVDEETNEGAILVTRSIISAEVPFDVFMTAECSDVLDFTGEGFVMSSVEEEQLFQASVLLERKFKVKPVVLQNWSRYVPYTFAY